GAETAFLGQEQLVWLKRELHASRATWKVIAADMPIGLHITDGPRWEGIANGNDGAALGRELEIAELLAFIQRAGVRNTLWLTADVHYCAAHHYHPNRAAFQQFEPLWEFVAGPLNAVASFGPSPLDGTFGPEVVFQKFAPTPHSSPRAGYQFRRGGDRRSVRLACREPARHSRQRRLQPGPGALAADLSRSAEQEVAGAGRAVQRRYLGFVLQLHAGELAAAGFAHQIQQTVRGEVVGETFGADVGDAVALGVVAADLWRPGEVEAQAVRRAEAGAFAQQDHRHARLESLADLVSNNGHTALFDEADRAQRPAFAAAVFDDLQRHRQGVALHGQRREAVGDHQGEVAGWLIELIQPRGAGFVQAPAQVRALQVELSVGGGAVQ